MSPRHRVIRIECRKSPRGQWWSLAKAATRTDAEREVDFAFKRLPRWQAVRAVNEGGTTLYLRGREI